MALRIESYCRKCKAVFEDLIAAHQSIPTVCPVCRKKAQDVARKQHFDELDKLTIEERIRKVEEWIYDYKPYRGEVRLG